MIKGVRYAFLLFAFALFSCGGNEVPEGIISEDQFVEVLTDVYIVEGMKRDMSKEQLNSQKLYLRRFKGVFDKHGITYDDFLKSFKFYEEDYKSLSEIYDKVKLRLDQKVEEIQD